MFPRLWTCLLIFTLIPPSVVAAQGIAAGKMIEVKLAHEVTTSSATVGSAVQARVRHALKDGNDVIVPAGSTLHGRVDFVQRKSVNDNGSLRLLFNRFELPDGRAIDTLASASFFKDKPKGKREHVVNMVTFAGVGALIGGKAKRVSAGLAGALIGLILTENRQRFGRDLTLRSGTTIQLRLSDDISSPARVAQ